MEKQNVYLESEFSQTNSGKIPLTFEDVLGLIIYTTAVRFCRRRETDRVVPDVARGGDWGYTHSFPCAACVTERRTRDTGRRNYFPPHRGTGTAMEGDEVSKCGWA